MLEFGGNSHRAKHVGPRTPSRGARLLTFFTRLDELEFRFGEDSFFKLSASKPDADSPFFAAEDSEGLDRHLRAAGLQMDNITFFEAMHFTSPFMLIGLEVPSALPRHRVPAEIELASPALEVL